MIYDIFNDKLESIGLGVYPKSVKLEVDYLVQKKSKITLNDRYAEIRTQDIVINRQNKELYRISEINNEKELMVYTGFDAINFPIFVQDAEIVSTDLEGHISTLIEDYWTNNADIGISLPIIVNTATTTNGNLLFFGKEDIDLRRICERAIQKYNIVVTVTFDNLNIIIDIVNSNVAQHTFRLEDPFINEFELKETEIYSNVLKWYAYDEFEVLHHEIYYLLNDNTVSQNINDPKRIRPVKEVVEVIGYDDLTLESARQSLQGQLSNNEIVIETIQNSSIDYINLGDKVDIMYKGRLIKSQLTGMEQLINTSQIKLTFGIGRNSLTDKLARRS